MPDDVPASPWHDALRRELAQRQNDGLLRSLRAVEPVATPHENGALVQRLDAEGNPTGGPLVNLASNDYLGLASHPRLIDAAVRATQRFGTGSGAARLVTGTGPLHQQAERAFARFKHAERALLLPTGYTANLVAITTLAQPGDLICIDKLNHASLIDAARASGATLRVFPHLDPRKLERILDQHASDTDSGRSRLSALHTQLPENPAETETRARPPMRFIITDSVFSMDGDCADLPALVKLRNQFNAILIVDEAHGTGVLGKSGAGLCELQGVADGVDLVTSTASKAMGSLGGIITASQLLIDTIINGGRGFIFSTAPPPSQPAAILAALDVIRDEPWRREKLAQLSAELRAALDALAQRSNGKLRTLPLRENEPATPIVPLIVGEAPAALALAHHLETKGFLAPAIRPPTVPRGASRLRISLRADLDPAFLPRFIDAVAQWL